MTTKEILYNRLKINLDKADATELAEILERIIEKENKQDWRDRISDIVLALNKLDNVFIEIGTDYQD